jgi:hypothetical protein
MEVELLSRQTRRITFIYLFFQFPTQNIVDILIELGGSSDNIQEDLQCVLYNLNVHKRLLAIEYGISQMYAVDFQICRWRGPVGALL